MNEKFVFFWKGPFSQWHRSKFTIEGIEYNCAEQWMMASKARLFGDKDTEEAIMKADHPREQKDLGRAVKGFVESEWNEVAREIVRRGNLAKFRQNPDLRKQLLATDGTLVEASPYDTIWGIGLAEGDPRTLDRETWLGTNWLGQVLTEVRDELKKVNWHD